MRIRSASVVLACLALALGCTAKTPPADEAEPEIVIPIGALVVLRDDATVYFEREGPTGVRLSPPPEAHTRGYTVEVLAATETRVEVRTLGPDHPPTCAGNFELADDYELRFWAEIADLHQVLVAPKTFAFHGGIELEFRPGVPVLDLASGELGVGVQSMFVDLEGAQLGLTYEPPATVEIDETGRALRGGTNLFYGNSSIINAGPPFTRVTDAREIEDPLGGYHLTFDNACGRFTLTAPANALSSSGLYAMKGPKDAIPRMARNFDPDTRQGGILGVMREDANFLASPYGGAFAEPQEAECTPARWTIASGVALTWASGGHPAGTVRRAHELPEDALAIGSRVCFELEGLGLCADASKLGREVDPDCPAP